ncbi:MAG: DUF2188 domain-containing protein [Synechococcales bacterium]|nr:DUF2188 domain-containing protein [Synechococcales bacterium]
MPWTYSDYPASMKNLATEARHKAIDIANALLNEGYEEQRSIAIATAQAEKWAKRRDKPVAKEGSTGSTGHAVERGAPDSDHAIHVVPHPQQAGWVARQDQAPLAQGKDKGDVLNKARRAAQQRQVALYVHDEQGNLVDEETNS